MKKHHLLLVSPALVAVLLTPAVLAQEGRITPPVAEKKPKVT